MAGTATPRPSDTKDDSSLKTTTTTTTTTTQQLPPENLKPTKLRHINSVASPMGVARTLIHLFSSSTQQRPRPLAAMVAEKNSVQHLRLITIGVSHFCEKARWGLDLLQQDAVQSLENKRDPSFSKQNYYYYTEDAHAPPFASFASVPASGDKASQTPMVVFTDNDDNNKDDSPRRILVGSPEILRELCPFLYPPEHRSAIMAMEDDLGRRLGASTRCIVYHHLLQPDHRDACRQVCGNAGTSSAIEAQLFRTLLDKGVAKAMRKFILVNEDTCAASLTELRTLFDEVSSRLKNNNNNNNKNSSYLFGDTFTAADLTFAALAYPVLQPPQTASLFGHVADNVMPPFLVGLRQELRATRAGQFALQMYQKHRFPKQQQGRSSNTPEVIALKSIGRNQWAGVRQLGTVTVGVCLVAVAARQVWQSFQ